MLNLKSKNVQTWRVRTKNKIIDAFDGKCGLCGYSKCINALELHHVNPEEKEFSISDIGKKNIRAWNVIAQELEKCVLLCANCHREVHADMVNIPFDIKRFIFVDGEISDKSCTMCVDCGVSISHTSKRCVKCANNIRRKVKNRPSPDELKILLMENTFVYVGELYGVSDNTIRKWLKASTPK